MVSFVKKCGLSLFSLALATAGLSISLSQPAPAGVLSELVLFSMRNGKQYRIFEMRPDGNALQPIVSLPKSCREPNLCKETNEIAFSVLENKVWNIYVLDRDKGIITRTIASNSNDRHPVWSPDGSKLIFETERWGQSEIALYDRASDTCYRLTFNQTINRLPTWSPDGQKIAYTTWINGVADISILHLNTETSPGSAADAPSPNLLPEDWLSKRRQLTRGHYPCTTPCWNPDSNGVVFETRDYQRPSLAIHTSEGFRSLKVSCPYGTAPAWSPDGQYILYNYSHRREHKLKLYDIAQDVSTDFPRQLGQAVCDLVWQKQHLPWQL